MKKFIALMAVGWSVVLLTPGSVDAARHSFPPLMTHFTNGVPTWSDLIAPVVTDTPVGLFLAWQTSSAGPSYAIARVNRTSGEVEAERALRTSFDAAAVGDGSLFVVTSSAGGVSLLRLDPLTLDVKGRWHVASEPFSRGSLVAAAGSLWVSGGDRLVRFSLRGDRITASLTVKGASSWSLASNEAGTELVDGEASIQGIGRIQLRNPVTGNVIAATPLLVGVTGPRVGGVVADGIWISQATGMLGFVARIDARNMRLPSCDPAGGTTSCIGGSNDITARVSNGVLIVSQAEGGLTHNYCADGETGRALAPIPLPDEQDDVLSVGPQQIYIETSPTLGKVGADVTELPIPTACSVSAPTATAAVPACSAAQLQISVDGVQGAAGNFAIPLYFKNSSSKPCSLFGYPGVSWVTASGAQIGAAAARAPDGSPTTVVLEPDQAGIAVVLAPTSALQQLEGCTLTQAAGIRVYAPGSATPVIVTSGGGPNWGAALTWCSSGAATATVEPIAAGGS